MNKLPISAIILTYNEEKNIEDCLKSIYNWIDEIFIVDSVSKDKTIEIAKKYTDKIYYHDFETHTKQWLWALNNLPIQNDWILGLDADQKITPELREELKELFKKDLSTVDGFYIKRRQIFKSKWIKYGGYYPKYLLKIFKKDKVWLDEKELIDHHFYVKGKTLNLKNDLIEHNLKEENLQFWLNKHLKYAKLAAMEEINTKKFLSRGSFWGTIDERRVFLKNIYTKLPLFVRAFLYFVFRYFLLLGFLDGKVGFLFHFFQGLWYRWKVDIEILNIKRRQPNEKVKSF